MHRGDWLRWWATRAVRCLIASCILTVTMTLLLCPGGAAAKTRPASRTKSSGGLTSPYGNDISYPQCGSKFPAGATFALVGVDDGIANKVNPCLGPDGGGTTTSELYWGSRLPGDASEPPVALYVNTADPGNTYNGQPIADWPKPGATVPNLSNPFGSCGADSTNSALGANSTGCAWVYGADIASLDASAGAPLTGTASSSFLSAAASELAADGASVSGAAASYRWWLDVETSNTWQSSAADSGSGLAMNDAVLEGMVQYLRSLGVNLVGIYATSSGWQTITGGQSTIDFNWGAAGNPSPSPLDGAPDWLPGAQTQSGATSNCSAPSFTGGSIAVAQWVQRSLDYDQGC